MSKTKVYCTQCENYRGYGNSFDPREHAVEKMYRCYRGGRRINYVTGVNVPAYNDCTSKSWNKWGFCPHWQPKLILRILKWRPKWL